MRYGAGFSVLGPKRLFLQDAIWGRRKDAGEDTNFWALSTNKLMYRSGHRFRLFLAGKVSARRDQLQGIFPQNEPLRTSMP